MSIVNQLMKGTRKLGPLLCFTCYHIYVHRIAYAYAITFIINIKIITNPSRPINYRNIRNRNIRLLKNKLMLNAT